MRTFEWKVGVWLVATAVALAAATVAFFLDLGTFGLGLMLGALVVVIYSFSVRKWALVFLYRWQIFRPAEIAQDAPTRARQEIEDVQREIDAGRLRAAGDIKARARAVLRRWKVDRAFRVAIESGPGGRPRVALARREAFGRLEQWLFAHAAMGAVAIFATLYHTGFGLGGPVSAALTISFLGACLTGLWGGWLYWVVPSRFAAAEGNLGFEDTRRQIERIDEELHAATERSEAPSAETKKDDDLRAVLELQRERLLAHYRPQLRYKQRLEVWLIAHVLLAVAALGLLAVHVTSVWWY